MRFMIIVKATKAADGSGVMPDEASLISMENYHEQLAKAGVLLDRSGLQVSRKGWRIQYDGEKRTVTNGPFAETKEVIAGYTIIQVRSREEALEWTRRFPNPSLDHGHAEIEVRQMFEPEDFEQREVVERFREIGVGGK
jgi:hypothetical protein